MGVGQMCMYGIWPTKPYEAIQHEDKDCEKMSVIIDFFFAIKNAQNFTPSDL